MNSLYSCGIRHVDLMFTYFFIRLRLSKFMCNCFHCNLSLCVCVSTVAPVIWKIEWLNVSCRLASVLLTVGYYIGCVFVCDWAYKYRNYNTKHTRNWIDVQKQLLCDCDPYQSFVYEVGVCLCAISKKNAQNDRLVCFHSNSHAKTKRNKWDENK